MISTALLWRYFKKGFVFTIAFTVIAMLLELIGISFSAGIPANLAPLTIFVFVVSTVILGWLVEFINRLVR